MYINQQPEQPRCALIVGHPGHELRILAWLTRMQPIVVALTDGSGHLGLPRVDISKTFLLEAGATPSRLYGRLTDKDIYSKLLEQDHAFFVDLAETIADLLIEQRVEFVAGDAIEGYNPTHDICRLLIDRAVGIASNELGYAIKNYAFPLVGHPSFEGTPENSIMIELSTEELALKVSKAFEYAQNAGGVLVSEVALSVTKYGQDAFAKEILCTQNTRAALKGFEQEPPFYELYGKSQVMAGFYTQAINYREHIAPIARTVLP